MSRAQVIPRHFVVLMMVLLMMVLLMMVLLGLGASTAYAAGWGGYIETERSTSSISDGGLDRGFDAVMGGLGFLYDSNVAADKLLNYQLQFGYRLGSRDLDEGNTETVNGLTLDQTLGFGFRRSASARVWGGPSVRLNFDWYSHEGDVDIVDLAIGIGPRVGINLHLSDQISFTASVSYHYMYLSELIETNGTNQTIDGPQHIVGIRLGILWRSEGDAWGN